jgi:cardiolipin synthase
MRHLPNLICLLRIVLIWPTVLALRAGQYPVTLALFVVAAVSDGLDGYLAKRFCWTSDLGRLLDPVADKLLLMVLFVQCAWLALVPWWLSAAVVSRDVMIGVGALIFRVWFGPLHGRPTVISKVNTGAQLIYLALVLLSLSISLPLREVLEAAALIVLATTVLSGAHYLRSFAARAWSQPART